MKPFYDYLDSSRVMYLTIIVLSLIALILTIGLLTPLITQLTTGAKLNLTPEYFNIRVALPVFALVVLLSICMTLNYFKIRMIIGVIGITILLSIASFSMKLFGDPWLDITLPIFILALAASLFKATKLIIINFNSKAPKQALRLISPHLIHIGLMMILIGVVLSTTLSYEDTKTLRVGDSFGFKKYIIKVMDIKQYNDSFSTIYQVDLDIYREGKFLDRANMKLIYDMRWIEMFEQGYSKVYINRMLEEDLFIAIRGLSSAEGIVSLYVKISPAISAIWSGLIVMAIGMAIIASIDRVPALEVRVKKRDFRAKYEAKFQAELKKRGGK